MVELLTSIAIIAVLLGIALPAWTSVQTKADLALARSTLVTTLTSSITYAGSTGTEVVLCPSRRGRQCANTWDWTDGWIAFGDTNGNRRRDPRETLLTETSALPESLRLLTSTGRRRVVIQPNGGNAGSNATFTLCSNKRPADSLLLVLSNRGQLRSAPASPEKAGTCTAKSP